MTLALILLGLIALYCIWTFNRFVKQRNLVDEAWSGVDVQLKRRSDLIPRLLDTVKGYAAYEVKTLEDIVAKRNQIHATHANAEQAAVEGDLGQGLGKIFALAEAYPDLKAQQNFLELQKALSEVEDQIQYARRYYNGTVRDYQSLLQSFPSNLIGKWGAFPAREFFEIEDAGDRTLPKVENLTKVS